MYIGEEMRFALHAHALCSVLEQDIATSASISLALRIIYSARRQLGGRASSQDGRYIELVRRMLDWESLTERDGLDHPLQALLGLCILDLKQLGLPSLAVPALCTLCNEALSR